MSNELVSELEQCDTVHAVIRVSIIDTLMQRIPRWERGYAIEELDQQSLVTKEEHEMLVSKWLEG